MSFVFYVVSQTTRYAKELFNRKAFNVWLEDLGRTHNHGVERNLALEVVYPHLECYTFGHPKYHIEVPKGQ